MARRSEDGNIHEIREAVGIVRLMNAALCVDCEHISEADGERCPRCASPSLLSLARILNREAAA